MSGDCQPDDGPPPISREIKYVWLAAFLRTHPRTWRLLEAEGGRGFANGMQTKINRGDLAAFRDPGYEATQRVRDDGRFDVWVRWVGSE